MKNLALIGVLTMSLALPVIGCGDKGDTGTDRTSDILALTGDSAAGETLYTGNCSGCHGADGTGTDTFPSLVGTTTAEFTVDTVLNGAGSMPSFSSLADQDIADVFAYVETF
ncbi:MAG: mono/diheme cytochrome c family protein [Myxococcota bacterium]|jgi:mono/diheme cytochrome c family protein